MAILNGVISQLGEGLKSNSDTPKSKEQVLLDAKSFEKLRQNMSTLEFVKQYENGLVHD